MFFLFWLCIQSKNKFLLSLKNVPWKHGRECWKFGKCNGKKNWKIILVSSLFLVWKTSFPLFFVLFSLFSCFPTFHSSCSFNQFGCKLSLIANVHKVQKYRTEFSWRWIRKKTTTTQRTLKRKCQRWQFIRNRKERKRRTNRIKINKMVERKNSCTHTHILFMCSNFEPFGIRWSCEMRKTQKQMSRNETENCEFRSLLFFSPNEKKRKWKRRQQKCMEMKHMNATCEFFWHERRATKRSYKMQCVAVVCVLIQS